LPGDVLSIEGLGSALWGTQPASIVRWVALPASKPKPPARAAQQLVPARPVVFGFALLRRACICFECAVTLQSAARALLGIEVLVRCASLLNAGWVPEPELGSNRCGRALAASEAGRTARADADPNFVALVRWGFRLVAWFGYAF